MSELKEVMSEVLGEAEKGSKKGKRMVKAIGM